MRREEQGGRKASGFPTELLSNGIVGVRFDSCQGKNVTLNIR
jgi:hypothetical protein